MPHEGFADPIMSDGTGFCSNIPVSELIKRITRAIEASDVSSTPPIVETANGAMISKKSQPSTEPLLHVEAQGKLDSQGDRARSCRTVA